eukprot:TRINITY_DN25925_c0_g1_i2.p1 TRINITY_DN25925_c0_g1~~TRINITY_DN25925_c0_g1_i2.p1  ORF type:complete len:425 (+),score=107.18 TRINITY_DN25925_c0_g1_i2:89-1363(+)
MSEPILSEIEAEQLRVSLAVGMSFWEEVGGIPQENYDEMVGSIMLLEEGEREVLMGELERLRKGSPPRAEVVKVKKKRKRKVEDDEDDQEASSKKPKANGVGGVPVPVKHGEKLVNYIADKIDRRKAREVCIDKLQTGMNPTTRIKSIAFVCSVDPIPECTDDECSTRDEEEEDEEEPSLSRTVTIPPFYSESEILLLCTDYLAYTPIPWLETVTVDDVAVQCVVLSSNGIPIPAPANWQDRGEASKIDRFKTYTYTRIPVTEGERCFSVQFPEGMSPWRACLIGVEVEEVPLHQYIKEVTSRPVPPEKQCVGLIQGEGEALEVSITLKCPLTQVRIAVPARGSQCAHPECFNLESFVSLSSALHAWSCPICDAPLPPSELLVDPLLLKIINTTEAINVWVSQDGTWKIPEEKKKRDVEVIELD